MDSSQQQLITPQFLFSRNARQLEAWNGSNEHRFLLYGGAAGGGKSFFLRWWCAFYLMWLFAKHGVRGANVGLFCEDYPSLLDRQISKIRYEFPAGLGELREGTTRDFVLRDEYGGGRILLRNLDDPAKYLSAEFAGIGVDELTRNERSVFDFLRSRLRWPGVDRPRFVGTTNPGGKGHKWVKALWVEEPKDLPRELEPLRQEFVFVPAKAQDNPYLSEQYFQDLQTLPPAMAKAYAEGSWDQFEGQYFDFADWTKKLIRPELIGRTKEWHNWISIDWGRHHPSAVHWHTREWEKSQRKFTYREFAGREAQGLTPIELAEAIVKRTDDGEKIGVIYLSPDAYADRTGEATIATQIGQVFSKAGLPHPVEANNDRIGGWMYLYQELDRGNWLIGTNCKELIQCLPTLVYDSKKVEDIAKVDGDDPADSARYGLYSPEPSASKPLDLRVRERVAELAAAKHSKVEDLSPDSVARMSMKALQQVYRGRPTRRTWRPGQNR